MIVIEWEIGDRLLINPSNVMKSTSLLPVATAESICCCRLPKVIPRWPTEAIQRHAEVKHESLIVCGRSCLVDHVSWVERCSKAVSQYYVPLLLAQKVCIPVNGVHGRTVFPGNEEPCGKCVFHGRHLGFHRNANGANPENPTIEPNMK